MLRRIRTATFAAVTFSAMLMVGHASPGFALELEVPNIPTTNVVRSALVPEAQLPVEPKPATQTQFNYAEIVQPLPEAKPAVTKADDDAAAFTTLAAAVAAQPSEASDDELSCLAVGVYFESKGEPLSGQLAVADVILNRAESGRFPRSVCSVLKQPGQFSFVRGGALPKINPASAAWRTAVAVARVARDALWNSPVEGALFFHARHLSPQWRKAKVASIGNHVFYR